MTFSHYTTKKFVDHLLWHFGHALETQYQRSESVSDSFQACKISHCEKRPNGFFFKLFSNSLSMKRLSSTCILQTHKSIWRIVSPTGGYLFFGSDGLFTKKEHSSQSCWKSSLRYYFILFRALETKSYEKGPFGVFFRIHSESLNMNNT